MSEEVAKQFLDTITVVDTNLNDFPISINKYIMGNKNIVCTWDEGLKYLKGHYGNLPRFKAEFISRVRTVPSKLEMVKADKDAGEFDFLDFTIETVENQIEAFIENISEQFDMAEPFTYKEAFELTNVQFQARVWETIDVREMFKNLPSERIHTEGIKTTQNFYNKDGSIRETNVEVDNIYELYKIQTEKIGGTKNSFAYAIKCWCTTTNEEHWLWVEESHALNKDPLSAIASTCRVPSNLRDKDGNLSSNLSGIKRQGDIFLFEFKSNPSTELDTENLVPLTKDEYFGLLKAQS